MTPATIYQTIYRSAAFALGCGGLWVQYKLSTEYYAGASPAFLATVPLVSCALAASLVAAEHQFRAHHYFKVVMCVFVFLLTLMSNLVGTLGRVSEYGAKKVAAAAQVSNTLATARQALQDAKDAEKEAADQVMLQCGKSRPADRCKYWTAEAQNRQAAVGTAQHQLDGTQVAPDAAADIKTLMQLTGLSRETVERFRPALIPITVEILTAWAFSITFAWPKPQKPTKLEVALAKLPSTPPKKRSSPRKRKSADLDLMPLVKQWVDSCDLSEGMPVAACLVAFEVWAKLGRPVNFVQFGNALSACGVEKRKVNGRVMIKIA